MKIGIYDPYLDDLGGGEKYMMSIASCLSSSNEVNIFWDNQEDLERLKERFGLSLERVKLAENIFSSKISFLKRLIASRNYDVIFFLSDGSIPLVLSNKLLIHVQQPLKSFQNTTFKDRIKLSRVNAIFCNSEFTKSFIDSSFNLKTSIIYPPVSLNPSNAKKENIILHVGRFRTANVKIGDYKKQAIMIEIFKTMIQKGLKGWKFVIAVSVLDKDFKDFEKMRQKTKGFPIDFAINKSNKDLWHYYNKAKIYWHASGFGEDIQSHPEYAEHFGISTVEAMGAGDVPVVVNLGGQKEIVTDGENGFLWNDKKECMEKTEKVIKDDKLWKKLSNQARIRAKDFTENEFCLKINKIVL